MPSMNAARRLDVAAVLAVLAVVVTTTTACGATDRSTPATTVPATTTAPSTTVAPATTAPPSASGSAVLVRPAVDPVGSAERATLTTTDGQVRSYWLYVPSALRGTVAASAPLLVALHGGLGGGRQFELNSGFDGLAEANGFLVVYPDGSGTGAAGLSGGTWNGGACCGAAARTGVDDVAFIRQVVGAVEDDHAVDASRVFAAGHSNGGIMAYRLACEAADVFSAVAVQSSTLEVTPCRPSRPVSLLHIHGTADRNVPIDGGPGSEGPSNADFNPPLDGIRTIVAADGCPADPTVGPAGLVDPANTDLDVQTWQPCDAGAVVQFVEVAGAAHAWMGHTTGGGPNADPYLRLDSSLTIWTFLASLER